MKQGPTRITSILLILIVLSSGYLDYWAYSQTFYREPKIWMDVVAGTASAPSQYRVGVIDTAYFLARHLHLGMRHTLALLDVVAALIAGFALFFVLRRSAVYQRAGSVAQWFGAAGFLVLLQFYLAWLLWYQRPETLPTAAILALVLLLLAVKLPLPRTAALIVPAAGILLLATAQGFVRADVAFALHAGILLVCLTPAGNGFALPRAAQAGISAVGLLLAAGIQYELMMRVYPQASYGHTSIFQLFFNLKTLSGYIPFLLFMVPVAWTAAMVARRRYKTDAAGRGMFVASLVFAGMWVLVGRTKEVRIFMPFALALTPLTVQLAMQCLLEGENDSSR